MFSSYFYALVCLQHSHFTEGLYCSNSFGSFLALRMYHMGYRVSNENFLTDWQGVGFCTFLEYVLRSVQWQFLTGDRRKLIVPETSVKDYHYRLRNIPEECRFHLHRGGSLKSRRAGIPPLPPKKMESPNPSPVQKTCFYFYWRWREQHRYKSWLICTRR